jgi:fatty-acyl-CoA synthase
MKRAAHLRKYGLKKGDRVAMVLPDGEDFVPTFLGAVWAGLVPVPLYPPLSLGKLDSYKDTMVNGAQQGRAHVPHHPPKMQQVLWAASRT